MSKAISKKVNKINYIIDPRIELVSAIQIISNYENSKSLITKKDFLYKRSMEEYFKPYKEHRAIKIFEGLYKREFDYDAPFQLVLKLSQPPYLEFEHELEEIDITRIDNENGSKTKEDIKKELEDFVKAMKEFAEDSNFTKFFHKNEKFYTELIEEEVKIIEGNEFIKQIEDYYGMSQNSYNFIFASIFNRCGFGPRVKIGEKYDIYSILGMVEVKDDRPSFGKLSRFRHMVWHEFSHSFINPLTDKHINEINKYEELLNSIKEEMEAQAYGIWYACVNEHIIRALTSRFSSIYISEELGEMELTKERIYGEYAYVEEIFNKLKEYENNRSQYKTFEEFYPQIVNLFKELKDRNLGDDYYKRFRGPISKLYIGRNPLAVILPTNEKDKIEQEELNSYLKQNFEGVGLKDIYTDKEALGMDLKDKDLLVYGTIEGNLWISKHKDSFSCSVDENTIRVLDKEFKGDNLSLIMTAANPENNYRGVNIYTGQRLEDIKKLRIHPDHLFDYMVFNGEGIFCKGRWIKK